MRKSSIKPKIKKNFKVLFIALFLSFFCVEIALLVIKRDEFNYYNPYTRIRGQNLIKKYLWKYNDVRFFNHKPNLKRIYKKPEFTYIHQYNSFGIRNIELDSNKINSSYKILCLGDSFTEGVGAPSDSTWPAALEKRLNYNFEPIITINGARSGSDIFYEFYKLKHLFNEKYKPNMAIFCINSTDFYDVSIRGGNERFVSKNKVKYKKTPDFSLLYSTSNLFRHFSNIFFNINNEIRTFEQSALEEDKAKKGIYNLIKHEIIPFAQEKRIKVLFMFTPLLHENTEKNETMNELMNELTLLNNISILNLFDVFSLKEAKKFYHPIDGHCNSKGYELWGNEVAKYLIKNEKLNPNIHDIVQ